VPQVYYLWPTLNRTGSKLLTSQLYPSHLYGADLRTIPGTIPTGTVAAALSDDGGRLFTIDYNGRIHVWNTSASRSDDSQYPELGTAGGTAPPVAPGAQVRMALSVDEKTLYLVGESALVVYPLP
jgi:hypothetical protein